MKNEAKPGTWSWPSLGLTHGLDEFIMGPILALKL
jgi:hypothetical protein